MSDPQRVDTKLDLLTATAQQVAEELEAGNITSVSLVQAYLRELLEPIVGKCVDASTAADPL